MKETRLPDIRLEDISDPAEQHGVQLAVTRGEFDKSKLEFEKSKRLISSLLVAVLLVCFIAFIVFIVDAWRFHATTVREFAATLGEMEDELRDSQMSRINARMDRIEKALLEVPIDLADPLDQEK